MSNSKPLLVFESPAKARTVSKFLGNDYITRASFGHVSDLPKSKLGFDPKNDFKPEYNVSKDKTKVVRELKSFIKKDTIVYLATDEDREGEAIAYHLIQVLGLKKENIRRIVFHEITKTAILHAIENPVELNYKLVDAAIARRVLDRAVGYKLSPLLWTKIQYGLSAGRTQSATVRLIVDRENEIDSFIPNEFWKLKLDILSNPQFKAELSKIDGKKAVVPNKETADAIKSNCDAHDYLLSEVNEKENFRTPPPPFITSTLQQAASSKMGFGVKQTMSTAQKLYEGSIRVPGHTGGLITYMRTDSKNLSTFATSAAKASIIANYGKEYALEKPRVYTGKSKGAQEAHEAIRPTNMALKPSDIRPYVDDRAYKLYSLIWSRTMATQMTSAKVANTTFKILGGDKKQYEYNAKGTKILFPGYMKVYGVGSDDSSDADDQDDKILPLVDEGTIFKNTKLVTEQNFTKPPARYTEASLVKKLETEGIGRPATYAPTISTVMSRGYVEQTKDKKLAPTEMGKIVNKYLMENFPDIVDLNFTANMENEFDKIAEGTIKWQTVMHNFYDKFVKIVEEKQGGDRVQFGDDKELGNDPKSGKMVYLKTGPKGSYLQLGEKIPDSKEKPRRAGLPKGVSATDLTLDEALKYLELPKVLGQYKDNDIVAKIGMFGPFVTTNGKFYSVKEDNIYTIELERAIDIIKTKDEEDTKSLVWVNQKGDLKVINGRYSQYLRDERGKGKAINHKLKIPQGIVINKNTHEKDVLSYIIKKGGKK